MILAAAFAAALIVGAAAEPARATVEESEETSMQAVVVKPGDTLWSIAHKYLKDPTKWDEILKHNRLPTADPTVALPGMVLKVPVRLIKSGLRAAYLVYKVNRVLTRGKDTARWRDSRQSMALYQGDGLRTLDESRARVKLLDKEVLALEPDSMAVIKTADDDADLELKSGSVFAGHARVMTANAVVTPRTRDTRYAASVEPDLTTKVEVYKGAALVDAQGSRVEVPEGMQTRVVPGLAPQVPRKLENLPELQARADEFASAVAVGGGAAPAPRPDLAPPAADLDAASLRGDVDSLHVGVPILGYRIQAATDREFKKIVFNRRYDSDERFSPTDAGLPPGAYWWRVAVVDLLGVEGKFEEPRFYTVGVKREERPASVDLRKSVEIVSPSDGVEIDDDKVRVVGLLRDDRLRVSVNGRPARADADGNFVSVVPIVAGPNEIVVEISDGRGDSTKVSRRVIGR